MRVKTIIAVIALVLFQSAFVAAQTIQNSSLGQIIVYIETPDFEDMDVSMTIDKIELISTNDTIIFTPQSLTISSLTLSGDQQLLIEEEIPEGLYQSLTIYLCQVRSMAGPAEIFPTTDSNGTTVPMILDITAGNAEVLFLSWNPNSSEFNDDQYQPHLNLIERTIPPDGSLVYVSNEGSGNISVIEHGHFKIVDVIKVGEQPREMSYSPLNRELYVANSGSRSISIIDLDVREVVRTILLNSYDQPSQIILSEDETSLYILNNGSDNITVIDLDSYEEVFSYNIGYEPFDMALDDQTGDLFVSSQTSNTLLNYNIINQKEINSLLTRGLTKDIEISFDPKRIFLANKIQRTLSIIDLENNENESPVNVCAPISSMVYNQVSHLLYAAIEECMEIVIIDPELKMDIGSIGLDYKPKKISMNLNTNEIMISYFDRDKIGFYNMNNRQLIKEVSVGQKPYMALMP